MKIAIPVDNGCLHGHFGGCHEFALIEVDLEKKTTLHTEMLPAPEHRPAAFPHWLHRHGVQVVIVGGIGRRALDLFAQQGITVRAGVPGAPVEELVGAFLEGRLAAAPEGCGHHGHHHAHRHHQGQGHSHGNHGQDAPSDNAC